MNGTNDEPPWTVVSSKRSSKFMNMESHFHQTGLALDVVIVTGKLNRRVNMFVLLTNKRQIMGDIYTNSLTASWYSKFKLTGLKASDLNELKCAQIG